MRHFCDACFKPGFRPGQNAGPLRSFQFAGRKILLHRKCVKTFEANLIATWNRAVTDSQPLPPDVPIRYSDDDKYRIRDEIDQIAAAQPETRAAKNGGGRAGSKAQRNKE